MAREHTEAEVDKIREDALAVREMVKSRGWQVLQERIDGALEALDHGKQHITTETEAGLVSTEDIGQRYLILEHRASGIKAVTLEVQAILREADKLDQPAK